MVVIPTIHASLREQRLPLDTAAFGVKVAHEPGNWLVSLSGEVDYAASLELNTTLGDIADRCDKDLLLDLSAVTMIDSEGIKTLLMVLSRMREKSAHARVVKCSRIADRVIRLIGLDRVMEISASSL